MQTNWVHNKDVKLWTESFGNSRDPAILLIIGAGAVSTFFPDCFCENLAQQGFLVIRYDQRDYGKSSHFPQVSADLFQDHLALQSHLPYKIEDLVADAIMILDYYDIAKACIVGHSMGGAIAQIMSITHPERVRRMISMSVGPASPHAIIEPIPEDTMKILYANQPQGNFENDKVGWMDSFQLLNGDIPFDKDFALSYLKDIYARDPNPSVAWNHIAVQQFWPEHDREFAHSKVPTLILHGAKDPIQPVSYVQAVQKLIPHAKTKVLPHLGHMFFNEKAWDMIYETVQGFMCDNHLNQ